MYRLLPLQIAAVLTLLCSASVGNDDAPPSVPPTSARDAKDFTGLDVDKLIRELPKVGSEWSWSDVIQDGVEHPAVCEMTRRLEGGLALTDDQWRAALLGTGAIRFHRRWPKDETYRISLAVPRWLGIAQIRLEPQASGMLETHVGQRFAGPSGTMAMIDARDARLGRPIGKVPPDTTEIVFDVEIERGRSWIDPPQDDRAKLLWRGTVTLPVELVESFDQVADPVDDEWIAEAVRDAIGAGIRRWGDADNVPFVLIDPDCARYPILETTGLDIKIEVLHGECVIAESSLIAGDFDSLALVSSIHSHPTRFYGSANLRIPQRDMNPNKWTLRLTGRCDRIALLWHARQYWSGSMTIPWNDAVEHEARRTAATPRGPEMGTPHWR